MTKRLHFHFSLSCNGEGNGTPLQYSCLENPMDRGAWWAAVHGVAKSRTWLSDFTFTFHFMHWRRKWQPTPVFLPRESQGRGTRWAAVYGVAQSRTRLKRLSSSSSSSSITRTRARAHTHTHTRRGKLKNIRYLCHLGVRTQQGYSETLKFNICSCD